MLWMGLLKHNYNDLHPIGLSKLLFTGSEQQDFQDSRASLLLLPPSLPNYIPPSLLSRVLNVAQQAELLSHFVWEQTFWCINLWLTHTHTFWVFPFFCYLCHSVAQSNGRDFRTQWETPRGRGKISNLTTEPVSLLLLPLRQFACLYAIGSCRESCSVEVICVAASRSVTVLKAVLHGLWTGAFWDMPVNGTLFQAGYSQSWSIRPGSWGLWCLSWRDRRLRTKRHPTVLQGNSRSVKCALTVCCI